MKLPLFGVASSPARRLAYSIAKSRRLAIVPAVLWYVLFTLAPMIPNKPGIDATTLPSAESILFGGFPHRWLSQFPSKGLDIVAAAVYSFHPLIPVVYILFCVLKMGQKDRAWRYLFSFGIVNLSGVVIQIIFPTAPPWWLDAHGFAQPTYGTPGDPADLRRVDEMLGADVYETTYRQSPIVFGSFPSLHAAWPFLVAIFSPTLGRWAYGYTAVVWWAAMYLRHHFMVDILGAVVICLIVNILFGGKEEEEVEERVRSSLSAVAETLRNALASRAAPKVEREEVDEELECERVREHAA